MPSFNPFGKQPHDLVADDLEVLLRDGVAEGWFIQFETGLPTAEHIARSVAAFANSDGGWIVVGVRTDVDNRAASIDGCEVRADSDPARALHEVIGSTVKPRPAFEVSALRLQAANRAVIVVCVERGRRPPYLTADGRIYRRAAANSHPVVETDRYAISRLFDRTADDDACVEAFCADPFATVEEHAGARQPFLELYFWLRSYGTYRLPGFSTEAFMERMAVHFSESAILVKGSGSDASVPSGATASIPFNAVSSSASSYVMRSYAEDDNLIDPVLTVELFDNGSARMFVPVPTLSRDRLALPSYYRHSPYLARLERSLADAKHGVRITDGFELLLSFAVLTSRYLQLLIDDDCEHDIGFRIRVTNAVRSVLFIDDPRYAEFIERHGPPICFRPTIEQPVFAAGEGTILEPDVQSWIPASTTLFEALGLPIPVFADCIGGFFRYIEDLAKLRRAASEAL